MKYIIHIILTVILILFYDPATSYAEEVEEYVLINVEYSDNVGIIEPLEVMLKGNNVYVNAEMISKRFGYKFNNNEESMTIYNTENENLSYSIIQFFYDNTKVSKKLFTQTVETYEAPFSSIKNDKGNWIPFEYSLLILNSGFMILDNCILIDIPTKNIVDCFLTIMKKTEIYKFEWNKDFGYSETDVASIACNSHIINLFNGLLEFDGYSWATLFSVFAMDLPSYDEKYSNDLAVLICTESEDELEATVEKMKFYQDIFSEKGQLGELLCDKAKYLDNKIGILYDDCEKILQDIKAKNSSIDIYNKSYRALEDVLDRQTWFSKTGGNLLDIQKNLSGVTGVLDILLIAGEIVGYETEFLNQDEFSLNALIEYINTSNNIVAFSKKMLDSIKDYVNILSSDIFKYSASRYIKENWEELAMGGISLSKILGMQANIALFAWNVTSNIVPRISNGLEGANQFELALYAQCFQSDAFISYQNLRNFIFSNVDNLSAEKLYQLSQYCYIFLKSCYITRNVALASLIAKNDSIKEQIRPLIDYQNSINQEIAELMVLLKSANKFNDGNVYGFLPSDNLDYLSKYNNSSLYEWVSNNIISQDYKSAFYQYLKNVLIPKYGLLNLNQETCIIYNGSWDTLMDQKWLEPDGIISAYISDMDFDKEDEMLLLYVEDSVIKADMYEIIEGIPTFMDTMEIVYMLDKFNSKQFVSVVNIGEISYIVCETSCSGVFSDGISQDYWAMVYKDGKFSPVFAYFQTGGGSTCFEFTAYEYGENGALTNEELLYAELSENSLPKFRTMKEGLKYLFGKYEIAINDDAFSIEGGSWVRNVYHAKQISILDTNDYMIPIMEYTVRNTQYYYPTDKYEFIAQGIDNTNLRENIDIVEGANDIKEESYAALLAYHEFLKQPEIEWEPMKSKSDQFSFFLLDVNGDGIVELFLKNNDTKVPHVYGYEAVYCFNGQQIKKVGRSDEITEYYPQSGIVKVEYYGMGGAFNLYQISLNGNIKNIGSGMGYDDVRQDTVYSWENKTVSESKFQELIQKEAGISIKIDDSFWRRNIPENRDKILNIE